MNDFDETIPVDKIDEETITDTELKCSECDKKITQRVYDYSENNFGKPLCYEHQKPYKAKAKTDNNKDNSAKFDNKNNRNNRNINPDFIVKIQGKEFITANGLLAIAEQEGGIESITVTELKYFPEHKSAYATVFVRMKDGREFSDCGSGTPDNLGSVVNTYPVEMAVTRARSRALRFGLNVDYVSADEIKQ